MISYKNIDILKFSFDKYILYNQETFDIKTPILKFDLDKSNNKLNIIINKYSNVHNILYNQIAYIERILNFNNINTDILREDFIILNIDSDTLFFDMNAKKVVYEPVKLTQDFRDFDFESPWEGKSQNNNND